MIIRSVLFIKHVVLFVPLFIFLFLATGCSDWRQAIGKEKYIPDEYAFFKTPKLIVPPGFNMESNSFKEDKKVDDSMIALEQNQSNNEEFESLFDLKNVPKNIRKIVDEETLGISRSERTGIHILTGSAPDTGVVLDSEKETIRIQKIQDKSILSGSSPSINTINKKTINIK